jgi:hypothetical protein
VLEIGLLLLAQPALGLAPGALALQLVLAARAVARARAVVGVVVVLLAVGRQAGEEGAEQLAAGGHDAAGPRAARGRAAWPAMRTTSTAPLVSEVATQASV